MMSPLIMHRDMRRYKDTKLQSYKRLKTPPRWPEGTPRMVELKEGGYTLIEVLIYGAIFSLFLLLTTQVFLTVRSMTANSFVMVNLQQNYARIFSDFNQTIRAAENVIFPIPGNSGETLSLNNGAIVYQVEGGVLQKVEGGTPVELSDEGVSVSAIVFENIGEATQTATIRIQMTIDSLYVLEGGRTIVEDLQTTIGLR